MFRHLKLRTALALAGLGLTLMASRASANWTALPGAIQLTGIQAHYELSTLPDGQGGMFVAWEDSLGNHHDPVRVTHLDRLGNQLWPILQLADDAEMYDTPPSLCTDGAAGIYVCWIRYENNVFGFYGFHVRLVHLDSAGNEVFQPISLNDDGSVLSPSVAPDGVGGAIVTWTNYTTTICNQSQQFWANRVDGNGNKLWGGNGRAVSPVDMVNQRSGDPAKFRAVPSGGAIYCSWTAMNGQCSATNLKVQRLDLSGAPTFDPAGLVIYTGAGSIDGYAVGTLGGDCLITISDAFGLRVKRVTSSGSIAWTQTLYTAATAVAPVEDGLNGVSMSWYSSDGLMAQDVGPSGQLLLPSFSGFNQGARCGDATFAPPGYPPVAITDGKGGVIVASPCDRVGNTFREIYCQGLSTTGRPAFKLAGLQVSPSGRAGNFVSGCPGLLNNALFAWGNGNGVWAQQVTLSNLDVLTSPPGWDANLVPRANNGATPGSVGATVLIEGNQTWLNWAVLQRGPNPTAAFQSRVYLDGNPTSNMFWGQNVGDGANPGFYKTLNFGPFNIPGGPHTLALYADEEFGPDFSLDEATESDDVWGRQWIWEPAIVAVGPDTFAPIGGFKGNSMPPNGTGHKMKLPGATPGAVDAWVVSNAARRGPTFDSSGGVSSYGDSYGLLLYDLPAGAGEFTDLIGESHQPFNGTNFIVSTMPELPDSLYPLEVRDSTADSDPDSSQFDLEFAGTRVGPGDGSSWMGQAMAHGELANVYVLTASARQTLHVTLTRRESAAGGDRPLAFEVFPPALEGQPTFVRGGGLAAQAASADIETLTFVAPRSGPYLVVIYRTDGSNAGVPLTYDLQSSGTQTLGVPQAPPRLEFAFAGAEPNPVHVGTEFAFTIPAAGAVSLMVYDVNGRTVRELVHGAQEAGRQRVHWDGRGGDGSRLGAGLYFARLSWGGRTSVRRVAVVP